MSACDMCGKEANLVQAEVDGAELNVCSGCAKYGTIKKIVKTPSYKPRFSNKTSRPEFRLVNDFTQLIKRARDGKGMKQEEFAKFLNEKESIVTKWENGSLRPRIETARRLEKVLNLKLVEKDEKKAYEKEEKKKASSEFTLGDFIKVRKRK